MPYTIDHRNKADVPSFHQLYLPVHEAMLGMAPLESRGHRPLKMTFEDQLKALIFFYLEKHTSGSISILPLSDNRSSIDFFSI